MSQEFIQSIILLLLTALITGFLIPYIFRIIDQNKVQKQKAEDARKQREQKRFEAEISRQAKIIDSQVAFLEAFADKVWKFQLAAIEVTYYEAKSEELYQNARANYQQNVSKMLGDIRALISKSIRLVPQDNYQQLTQLYYEDFLNVDIQLQALIQKRTEESQNRRAWVKLNQYAVKELGKKVDNHIDQLAKSMNLKVSL